jgi:hypothetical protein
MASSNLAISVRADTSEARAQLALVQSEVRGLGRSLAQAANDARGSDLGAAVTAQMRQLATQIEAGRAEIARLNAQLKETATGGFARFNNAIKAPLEDIAILRSSLRETAELAGALFVVDKIREFTTAMGELGERTVNMAAAVGTTPHEFSALSGALRLAGGDAETAGRTLERIGKNIEEAITVPSSQAAKAAASLGISQQELRKASTNLGFALDLLANKFTEFNASPLKTADFLALTGRSMDQLVPLFRRGAQGFEELKKEAEATGIVLSDQDAAALDKTGEKLRLLSATIEGEGIRGFRQFEGAIDGVVDGLTSAVKGIGSLNTAFSGMISNLPGWAQALAQFNKYLLLGPLAFLGGSTGNPTMTVPNVSVTATGKNPAPWPGAKAKGGETEIEAWRRQLQEKLELDHNFFSDSTAEELAFWQGKVNLTKRFSKERAEVENTIYQLEKRLAIQQERDAEESLSSQQRISDAIFARKQQEIQSEERLGKISATEALAQEKALLEAKWAADQEYYAKKRAAAQGDSREQQKINEAEALAYQAYLTEMQHETEQAALAVQNSWKTTATQFSDALDKAIDDMLLKTESLKQAIQDLARSITEDLVKSAVKSLTDSALGIGTQGAGGGGGLGSSLFSSFFGKIFGGGLAGMFGGGGSTLVDTGTDFAAGATGGGGLASLFGFEHGGIVPSAAGGWAVPQLGSGGVLANLHSNEMVLPSNISQGLQGMIAGGGGGGVSLGGVYINAVDSRDVGRLFMNNGSALVAALNRAMRNGSALSAPA